MTATAPAPALEPGDAVYLNCPGNPFADGQPAVVLELFEWGAKLKTEFGSGEFRATFDEMKGMTSKNGTAPRRSPAPRQPPPKASGYSGDDCTRCGSMAMVRTGVCCTCQNCGETTSCS